MKLAPCPLCGSEAILHPAEGLCVAGASCSNLRCILHEMHQNDANKHVRLEEWPKGTVWIYTDRRGAKDALIVFADQDTANAWFRENDPEGVAFEHPVVSSPSAQVDRPRPETP